MHVHYIYIGTHVTTAVACRHVHMPIYSYSFCLHKVLMVRLYVGLQRAPAGGADCVTSQAFLITMHENHA